MSEDRPLYQAERDTVPTNAEIAERLRTVAHEMRDIGMTMDYVGGLGATGFYGRMMIYMAQRPMDWADEIEEAQG